ELQDEIQEMTLSRDRSFTFTIDRGNYNEQMMVKKAGEALARQIDEVIVPEIDQYRLAAMSAAAIAAGGTAEEAIDASNAYASFLKAAEYMSDNKVPLTNRVAFVTPAFYSFIKLDNSFIRYGDNAQQMLIKGVVG